MQHFASGKRYAAGFPACSRRKTSDESVAVPNESFTLPANVGMAGSFKRTVRIMKLTAVLLTLAFLQVQANGLGQDVTLNVKEEKLEKVFSLIEKQTGYVFFTTADLLKKARPVTLQVRNEALSRALDLCFKGQALDYVIQGKTISVVERKAIPVSNPISINTEQIKKVNITGRVVNENDEPVAGATVMVKGSTYATATDEKGEFRLEEIEENSTLIITGANIETNEVKIRGRENVAIKVQSKIAVNEAVVVTVNTGYQTFKPNEMTGSVTTLSNEQLTQRVAPDIISKIEGITNGLIFNKTPSGKDQIRIRGESTIFANPNPLIVIDNFPYDGDISSLNPNDVESITILKDAAAASIYGVQAANGVIVITTKKGRSSSSLKVELNTNLTITDKPDLFYAPQIMPTDYIDFETFLFSKGFYNSSLNDANKKAVSPIVEILNNRKLGLITAADSVTQINNLRYNDIRNDIYKYVYRKAILQQYQLNLSGGNNKVTYYFSGGYDNNLASAVGNQNDRITLNTQTLFKPVKGLELRAGIFYTQNKTIANAGAGALTNIYPYQLLKDNNGNDLPIPQRRSVFEDTIVNHGFLNWKKYPLQEINHTDTKDQTNETRLLAGLKYNLPYGINIDFSYQYERIATLNRVLYTPESYFIRDRYNTFAIVSNGNFIGSNYNNQQLNRGLLDLLNNSLIGHHGRLSLNYNYTWHNHSILAIAGAEVKEVRTESNGSRLYGYDNATGSFVNPNLFVTYPTYPSLSAQQIASPGSGFSHTETINRFRSYFYNSAYTYKKKYTLSVSTRFDGSNYFGVKTNQKTVPLWSTGFKWDFSKESFYRLHFLPVLNLRISYGYNGNLMQNLAAITTFKFNTLPNSYTGLSNAAINNIPNPELRWEKNSHLNMGFDFSSKNNRISGSIEYYQKNGDDLIGDALLDPTTGVTQIRGNFSGMKSKGIDVQINSLNVNKKLSWSSSFIFNYTSEKVTRYDITPSSANVYLQSYSTLIPQVGRPLYSLYSYRWAGLDPSNGNPRVILGDTINNVYSTATTSNLKINDLIYNGRYNPPFWGSIINSFSYKGIDLTFNITYKFGHYFRRSSINYTQLSSDWQSGHKDYALRWQKAGDENRTNVPSISYPFNNTRDLFYTQSDVLVEKGDHIRLQFINLTYNFNTSLLNKLSLQGLQAYFYANNLGILWRTNSKGIDPDYPYLNSPSPRTYSVGLKIML